MGVGGLINAYRTAAKEAVQDGKIIERELRQFYSFTFNYEDMPHIMNIVKQPSVEIIQQTFEKECELKLNVALDYKELLLEELTSFTSLKKNDLGIK